MRCDFCSGPGGTRRFPCLRIDPWERPELRCQNEWLACSVCGTLIDTGNWDDLLLRALDRMGKDKELEGIPPPIVAHIAKHSHEMFRRHWVKA